MKKHLLWASMAALALFIVPGCSKDDTDPPVITLIGDDPYTVEMRSAYVDPGATAQDEEDGDLTSSIQVDISEVNMNLPGDYAVYYTVSDAAGNIGSANRTVDVIATANALEGTYSVTDSCGSGASLQVYTYSQSTVEVNSNTIRFNKFADYSGNANITATIDAQTGNITLPLQSALNIGSLSEDHDFQGTGGVISNGFIINYTDRNNSVVPVSTASCRAYFTR